MALNTLIENALDLEEIEENIFRSKSLWKPLGARAVFGGQVVGHSLMAANKTVPEDFSVHSLHSYFILPGDSTRPILYNVHRTRDGSSFITRTVTAIQKGRAIFSCQLSFQKSEDFVLEHQDSMPPAPDPESLPSETDRLKSYLEDPRFPKKAKEWLHLRLQEPLPIDIRMCNEYDPFKENKIIPPRQMCWMRANGKLGDDQKLHQCVAAYASDHRLLSTPLLAHGLSTYQPGITIMASLDHSLWFHAPFRADEWLLYDFESPRMRGNRGLAFGKVYKADGTLAISVAQEGLIRVDPTVYKKRNPDAVVKNDRPKKENESKL